MLDELLDEDEESSESQYEPLKSPARMIFKVELCGSGPLLWPRFSLPGDASFFDLHCAIQDSMGWEDRHQHQFEFRSQGKVEATFSSNPVKEVRENDFCGVGNRIAMPFLGVNQTSTTSMTSVMIGSTSSPSRTSLEQGRKKLLSVSLP